MKKYNRTRAKAATLSFPVKSDKEQLESVNINKSENKFSFKESELFPLIDNNLPGDNKIVYDRPTTHFKQKTRASHQQWPITIGDLGNTNYSLNFEQLRLDWKKDSIKSIIPPVTDAASNISNPVTSRLPPPLNSKLKFLKSQLSPYTSSMMNSSYSASATKFLPFSQLKPNNNKYSNNFQSLNCTIAKTSSKIQSKQYSPTTTSSYYSSKPNQSFISPATSLPIPSPPSLPSSSSNKSKISKKYKVNINSSPSSLKNLPISSSSSSTTTTIRNEHISDRTSSKTQSQKAAQKPKLVATTTEIEQLKLTPRNPNTIKPGMFIENPNKINANDSGNKKYHIIRSVEERESNPDTIYLDKFNLKHFPSIDSSEISLRLLSLQHNLIHRIDNNNNGSFTIQANLLVLDLYNNRIDRISGLHVFSSLKVLLLGKNRIRRVEGLDSLKHLEILDLHGNQLRYLDNVNSLTSLRVLNVAGNIIRSIRNFGPYGISPLTELNLKRNHIQNLGGLLKMIHLKKICLGNNNIQTFSMLLPLKKLELLNELLLTPNPICELPDYFAQILSLLSKLEILDTITIDEEMRKKAEIWYKNKLIEEHERKKELDKLKFLSSTSTRDEVILKARKRWESVRNYVKQNSVGSGKDKYGCLKRENMQTQDGGEQIFSLPDPMKSASPEKSSFTVELEELVNPTDLVNEIEIPDPEISNINKGPTNQFQTLNEGVTSNISEKHDIDNKLIPENNLEGNMPLLLQVRANSKPPIKVAIVKPSIRSKVSSVAICTEDPDLVMPKIPMLIQATAESFEQNMGEEDDVDEDISDGTKFVSAEFLEKEEIIASTTLNETSTMVYDNSAITSQVEEKRLINEVSDLEITQKEPIVTMTIKPNVQTSFSPLTIPVSVPVAAQQSVLKLPEKRAITMRRSMSTNVLLSVPSQDKQFSTKKFNSPSNNNNNNLSTSTRVKFRKQDKLRNPFSRSQSISELQNNNSISNDSDTISDVESVTTINSLNTTTSETGSNTTTSTTTSPRKISGRPKLVRSNSSRYLLKPRGKTARVPTSSSTFLNSNNQKRPLTSIASNNNSTSSNALIKKRPILRRSESAMNLATSSSSGFLTNNSDNTNIVTVLKKQGVDYLIEVNDKLLNVYGQGALKHILTAFSSNSTGNITMVTFHFITFDSIISYFSRMRQIYPSLEHFHFRANGLICLAQLNALADLQGITTLYIYQDGNPLVENEFWEEYAMYRLGHWGLQQINGNEVGSNYRSIGSIIKENDKSTPKTFDSLGYLALSCLPQSALTPLAERLHMLHCFCCCSTSNSSDESGKKKSDTAGPSTSQTNNTKNCTSYWDDDPVLLDVIGKEALVYVPSNEIFSNQNHGHGHGRGSPDGGVITEIFENGCEIINKLNKLEEIWPSCMIEVIEDILLDYQVMDNFMKKELAGLKNNLSANSSRGGGGSIRSCRKKL